LLLANVNPKIVSERLGRASIELTRSTYSHVLPTMQQVATEKLDDMLGQNGGTEGGDGRQGIGVRQRDQRPLAA
jgi:hypothetical protein